MHCGNITPRQSVCCHPRDSASILGCMSCSTVHRTTTYNYISALCFLASVGGGTVASLLLSHHVYFLNGISTMSFVLAAMIATFIPSHCGRDSKIAANAVPILSPAEDDDLLPESLKGLIPMAEKQVTKLRKILCLVQITKSEPVSPSRRTQILARILYLPSDLISHPKPHLHRDHPLPHQRRCH